MDTRNDERWVRIEYLRDLTIRVYQVRTSPCYVQDKLQRDPPEEFQIEMITAWPIES